MKLIINNKFNKILKKQNFKKPYVIAEIGVNHEGSLDKAKSLVYLAKKSGANAVKFQAYKASTIASKISPAYWDTSKEKTKSQYSLFKKYDSLNKSDYIKLSKLCRKINIDFACTPFDDSSIEFLAPLMDYFKIASADITTFPLLKKIAQKRKPVILSTGAANIAEIKEAIGILKKYGCPDIALLHCVLNYPTPNKDAKLNNIKILKELFTDMVIGYSDHTIPSDRMEVLVTASILGASIIEKHFTHDKNLKGNDHYHAMDSNDLNIFIKEINNLNILIGNKNLNSLKNERLAIKNARRGIVAKKNLKKNYKISEKDITYLRPNNGISAIYWESVIGKKIKKDVKKDTYIKWEDLEINKN